MEDEVAYHSACVLLFVRLSSVFENSQMFCHGLIQKSHLLGKRRANFKFFHQKVVFDYHLGAHVEADVVLARSAPLKKLGLVLANP